MICATHCMDRCSALGRVIAGAGLIVGWLGVGACSSEQSSGGDAGRVSGGTQSHGEGGGAGTYVGNSDGGREQGGQAGRPAGVDASGVDGSSVFPLSPPSRRRIAVGNHAACGVSESSGVVCWGGAGGESGSRTALAGTYRTLAMGPSLSESICAIAVDGTPACALTTGGTDPMVRQYSDCIPAGAFSWITLDRRRTDYLVLVDTEGQLQVFSPGSCALATVPSGVDSVRRAVMMEGHVCAIHGEGSVSCWVLGLGTEPTPDDTFVDVAAGSVSACGATTSGKVRCWNADGTERVSAWNFAATASQGGSPVIQLATEGTGSNLCALMANGKVLCSQEFDLRSAQPLRPLDRETLVEIAVGFDHLCGVRPDDTVLCISLSCSGDCVDSMSAPDGFKTASR